MGVNVGAGRGGERCRVTVAAVLWCLQDMGPHIFQTCPSANHFDCKAMSIGARSQSARTYLERLMDKFADCEEILPSRAGALRTSDWGF